MLKFCSQPILRPSFLPTALVLLGLTYAAAAQKTDIAFFTGDVTISSEVKHNAIYVGYASLSDRKSKVRPTSPTVKVVKGSAVRGSLSACNSSKISVSGGTITGDVSGYDQSSVTVSGGAIAGSVTGFRSSVVTVSGGSITGSGVSGLDNSTINIRGGSITGDVSAADTATLNLYGSNLKATPSKTEPTLYDMSGKLADGTRFEKQISVNKTAKLVLHNTPAH